MDNAPFFISIFALLFTILQFCWENNRQKKESTLKAYDQLQEDVFAKFNTLRDKLPKEKKESEEQESSGRIDIDKEDKNWPTITNFLVKLEHFSVGINTGIYSLEVLNRVGGSYFIKMYDSLSLVMEKKRKADAGNGKHYDEFETTVRKLKKYRSRSDFYKRFLYPIDQFFDVRKSSPS